MFQRHPFRRTDPGTTPEDVLIAVCTNCNHRQEVLRKHTVTGKGERCFHDIPSCECPRCKGICYCTPKPPVQPTDIREVVE